MEIVERLCDFAKKNLQKTKVKNVEVINANGYLGWEKLAPYDRIIAIARADEIPDALFEQLKEKGIIVIPININSSQIIKKVVKINGKPLITKHGEFRFVPFRKI